MTPHALVTAHLSLVRTIATTLRRSLLTGASPEDLESDGYVGLCEAAQRYEEGSGATFSTFAYYRIRGAMVDGYRKEMGGRGVRLERVSLSELPDAPSESPDPEAEVDHRRQLVAVAEAAAGLPERERALLVAEAVGLTVTEAGEELGMTKSWASRLRARAVATVRAACASRPVRRVVAAVQVVERREAPAPLPVPVVKPVTQAGVVRLERMGGVFRGRTPFRAPVVGRRVVVAPSVRAADIYSPSRWREPAPPPRSRDSGAPPGRGRAGPEPDWGRGLVVGAWGS
jgi:RNA polymerase sigma factor for flagellar operon FliA